MEADQIDWTSLTEHSDPSDSNSHQFPLLIHHHLLKDDSHAAERCWQELAMGVGWVEGVVGRGVLEGGGDLGSDISGSARHHSIVAACQNHFSLNLANAISF